MDSEFLEIVNVSTKELRHEKIGDKEYYVVPGTVMVEGVHGANHGKVLYQKEALSQLAGKIENVDAIINHPSKKGKGVLMNEAPGGVEKVRANQGIGFAKGHKYSHPELQTEFWIDKQKIKKVSPKTERKLLNGDPIEVSIGVIAKKKDEKGVFNNNQDYIGIVHSLEWDHIAILPDKKGACDNKKGCGINNCSCEDESVLNGGEELTDEMKKSYLSFFGNAATDIALSFDEITTEVRDALRERFGQPGISWYGYPVVLYSNYVIFCASDCPADSYFKLGYSVTADGEVTLDSGTPDTVVRVVSYQTADGKGYVANSAGELSPTPTTEVVKTMSKETDIKLLITNGSFDETARPELEKMDEGVLAGLAKLPAPKKAVLNEEKKVVTEVIPATEQEWYDKAPPKVKAFLNEVEENIRVERDELVAVILNSASNEFTKEELEDDTIFNNVKLRKLANLATPKTDETPASKSRFAGSGSRARPVAVINQSRGEPKIPVGQGLKCIDYKPQTVKV